MLIFTGGIGENSRGVRARSVQGLDKIGIAIDHLCNECCSEDDKNPVYNLTAGHSRVTVLAVATNEELMIARQCALAFDYKRSIKKDVLATDRCPIRVAVSAHHVHLCRRYVEALFGNG